VLLSGMVAQWLIDPKHSLSAQSLTGSLLNIAAGLQTRGKTAKPKRKSKK
jgi:hypothetical protein